MASRVLYPPVLAASAPAFVSYGEGEYDRLNIYFSLSEFNNTIDISDLTAHVQIYRYDGVKVLDTSYPESATGILVNKEIYSVSNMVGTLASLDDSNVYNSTTNNNNYYYISIRGDELTSTVNMDGQTFYGFIPGWTYKIQIRLSTQYYDSEDYPYPEAWLQEYSSYFSEWSSICYVKAIAPMAISLPCFNYYFNPYDNGYPFKDKTYTISNLDLTGSIQSAIPDVDEDFEYVRFLIYKENSLIEDSGEIFKSSQSKSYFSYKPKTKFIDGDLYQLRMAYETESGYNSGYSIVFNFKIVSTAAQTIDAILVTVDTDTENFLKDLTFLDEEEDEGRIALKIKGPEEEPWSGNICIQRASQDDNFQTWEDIIIFTVKDQLLNDLDLIYDYTIESGKWYKYGIQSISSKGKRGRLVEMETPIHRLFNYSYLLGQNNQQLKLEFNNVISNFRHQLYDTKTDTIGSKYPFFSRDAVVNYRTFNVSALISFNMDENHTFLKNGKKDLYNYNDIVNLYEDYSLNTGRYQYDYTYERDFRAKVLDFLQDGKPKLFKSPSEGNIIIRLSDVNCSPDKTTDRLIYSLSFNANEFDDNTMDKYLKYGFYNPGTYSTNLSTTTMHIGQLSGEFDVTDNIISLINEKYSKEVGNFSSSVNSIERVKITFNGWSYQGVYSDGPMPLERENGGYLITIGNIGGRNPQTLIVPYPNFIYTFDSNIKFGPSIKGSPFVAYRDDKYSLLTLFEYMGSSTGVGPSIQEVPIKINATIDFYYTLITELIEEDSSTISEETITQGIGQFYETVTPGTSIYNSIYYKYYIKNTVYNRIYTRTLTNISRLEIEADPYTVFSIRDTGAEAENYEVDATGILRLEGFTNVIDITYVGKRYLEVPFDESTLSEEIITEDNIEKGIKASADVSILYDYTLKIKEGYNDGDRKETGRKQKDDESIIVIGKSDPEEVILKPAKPEKKPLTGD